jgi:hypothetical protein
VALDLEPVQHLACDGESPSQRGRQEARQPGAGREEHAVGREHLAVFRREGHSHVELLTDSMVTPRRSIA